MSRTFSSLRRRRGLIPERKPAALYFGTVLIASEPWIFVPVTVCPLRNAVVSPATNPVRGVLKRHIRSFKPSPLTSCPPVAQDARLASLPVWPKVKEFVFIWVTALKVRVDKIATGIFPFAAGLIGTGGDAGGLISIRTGSTQLFVG